MNRTGLGLVLLLVVLGLLGANTTGLTTLIIASLVLSAGLTWIFTRKPPKNILKTLILVAVGPLLFLVLGGWFIQTLSILDIGDAILLIILVAAAIKFGPRLLK